MAADDPFNFAANVAEMDQALAALKEACRLAKRLYDDMVLSGFTSEQAMSTVNELMVRMLTQRAPESREDT